MHQKGFFGGFFVCYNLVMNQRLIDFVELIEANPFTPLGVLIEDFFGADIVLVLKTEKNREDILKILQEAGIEEVL